MFLGKLQFVHRILGWYDQSRRDLPWRVRRGRQPVPYHVLVSEMMLQQTQVKTVIPYFKAFLKRWPTIAQLASAEEQQVLRAWQGLGYYSRARNLLAAARQIVSEHQGQIPRDVESLLKLSGIGRYTAGAIASLAFDSPAPILDGNVARVLCRLDAIESDPRETRINRQLWKRATELVPRKRAGDFNSAMMELGATICTPRSPQCLICPVQRYCQAFAAGKQDQIPPPRKRNPLPIHQRCTFCLRRGPASRAIWLIEQRSSRGRWAGMWQFVTVEANGSPITPETSPDVTLRCSPPRHIASIEHTLTHRRYRFDVYLCHVSGPARVRESKPPRRWVSLDDLQHYPLPKPHLQIAQMLRKTTG